MKPLMKLCIAFAAVLPIGVSVAAQQNSKGSVLSEMSAIWRVFTDSAAESTPTLPTVEGTEFGEPISGLTAHEFELFRLGLEDFLELEDAQEGLGPVFNGRSCAECHSVPRIGGSSTITEIRAGLHDADGNFVDFPGGSVIQMFSIPAHEVQAVLPPETAVVSRRKSLPVFGSGLVEAVPDETLIAMADPEDLDGDGISGRINLVFDVATRQERVGRFGWKAQQATLMAFGAEAYRDEMGITSDLFPNEACPPNVDCEFLEFIDPVPDPEDGPEPETGLRGIDNFNNFLRLIGPPPRGERTAASEAGQQLFSAIGCTSCHVPYLETGPDPVAALANKSFFAYSDFLLHDIGTGDGIVQAQSGPEEIRTTPLWGVRFRAPFLHDGSASTLRDAIGVHRNEAEAARTAFEQLTPEQQEQVLEFLRSL